MATPDPSPSVSEQACNLPPPSIPALINPIQFHYSVNPKLDDTNFLLWKSQVLPMIRGHGLLSFLDGTAPNSGSEPWNRQDQLILAWILSSLGSSILPQAINCQTSADLWSMVHRVYSAQSQSKMLDLKSKLQTLQKGDLSCSEYLNSLTAIALQLRSIGCEISDQDLSLYLFAGLPAEYNPLVTSLTSQPSPMSLVDLHGHLLNYENRLLSQLVTAGSNPSAYISLSNPHIPSLLGFESIPLQPGLQNSKPLGSITSSPQICLPNSSSTSIQNHASGLPSGTAPDIGSLFAPMLLNSLPWQS